MPDLISLELDITLRCNGKCVNCARHCNMEDLGVDNTNTDMALDQVAEFSERVKKRGNVERIRVMGGEPLLHPKVDDIILLLKTELLERGYIKNLEIISNNIIRRGAIHGIKPFHFIGYRYKKNHHACCLAAPVDTRQRFRCPCKVPMHCGFGYNYTGCYPCGTGSAICRLFDLKQFRLDIIPDSLAGFGNLYDLCKLCQLSVRTSESLYEKDHGRLISKSYQERFDLLKNN